MTAHFNEVVFFNSKATPTTGTDYSYQIDIAELV